MTRLLAPGPTADDARRAAAEVFDRPEFRSGGGDPSIFLRPLRDFFAWLGSLYGAAPVLFWVMLVGCLIALVLMIALIVYQVKGVFAGRDRMRGGASSDAHRERVSAAYRDEADRRAAAGDYTEAVRFLFLSLVYRLDERGRVNFQKAYTNREYLALVGDRLPAPDTVRLLVDTLDDHWYGQTPCDRRRYDECRAVYDRLA
jgi:uncharacterized membrane protein